MPRGYYQRTFTPLKERLLRRITTQTDTGCWIWLGSRQSAQGHGQLAIGGLGKAGKRLVAAHRASWMVFRGPIPAGLIVCHHCDNPPCVNPEHLFLGTKADNTRDMVAKGRQKHGPALPQTKHSFETVKAIRNASGPQSAIAKKFGVSQGYVWQIRNNRLRQID
jgi:hypothetical protein